MCLIAGELILGIISSIFLKNHIIYAGRRQVICVILQLTILRMIADLAEMGNRTREGDKSWDRNRHRKQGRGQTDGWVQV